MRRTLSQVLVLAGLFFFAGAPSAHAQKQKGDRNKITKDDLADAPGIVVSATDAVRVLRPNWFNLSRASSSVLTGGGSGGVRATDLVVYIDGIRQTSKDQLDQLKASLIVEMKFLDQNRAVQDYGPGHEMGVIDVTTVNKRK